MMQGFEGEGLACVRGERLVFAGLDFSVGPGEALLLTGPNGSGKSSLLRLMAGLLRPAAGRLAWDGAAIAGEPEGHRARLHYVGHQDPVKPMLTVRESVAFWSRLHAGGEADGDPVSAALAQFGIDGLATIPGRFLSAGQRRRTNLARLLAAPAVLWLLDEPTVGLDDAAVAAFENAVARHRHAGGIVVAATHAAFRITDETRLDLDAYSQRQVGSAA